MNRLVSSSMLLLLCLVTIAVQQIVAFAPRSFTRTTSTASHVAPFHSNRQSATPFVYRSNGSFLFMSSEEEEETNVSSGGKRKRRKRKDGKNVSSIKSNTTEEDNNNNNDDESDTEKSMKKEEEDIINTVEEQSPRPSAPTPKAPAAPIEMKVMDVRQIVSGTASTSSSSSLDTTSKVEPDDEYYDDDDEEDDDDDEYEYYYEDENDNEVIVGTTSSIAAAKSISGGGSSSSLEALLADARKLRAETEDKSSDMAVGGAEGEGDVSIGATVRKVLSAIVTADFFVVCALLLWFLAGIFCSYVVKDDTVQIAFNGIFQPVVQPALGILMIGSAASAVFNDKEEES